MQDDTATQERIFAVGDIHGSYRKLVELMDRLPMDRERDTLVFLGDYINRGPQSREVLDYLIALRDRVPRSVFLMGNHEYALLDYAASGNVDLLPELRILGVEATLKSYGDASVRSLLDLSFLPPEHLEFLESLEFCHRQGPYLFVHADAPDEDSPWRGMDELVASRRLATASGHGEKATLVFGHTPLATPLVAPGRIGIDTGAVYGNLLTAVELPTLQFHHS